MRRFTEAEIIEVWDRRQAGELTRSIARRLGRNGSSIRRLFEDTGGVRPAPRRRAERHLTLVEREEIEYRHKPAYRSEWSSGLGPHAPEHLPVEGSGSSSPLMPSLEAGPQLPDSS